MAPLPPITAPRLLIMTRAKALILPPPSFPETAAAPPHFPYCSVCFGWRGIIYNAPGHNLPSWPPLPLSPMSESATNPEPTDRPFRTKETYLPRFSKRRVRQRG